MAIDLQREYTVSSKILDLLIGAPVLTFGWWLMQAMKGGDDLVLVFFRVVLGPVGVIWGISLLCRAIFPGVFHGVLQSYRGCPVWLRRTGGLIICAISVVVIVKWAIGGGAVTTVWSPNHTLQIDNEPRQISSVFSFSVNSEDKLFLLYSEKGSRGELVPVIARLDSQSGQAETLKHFVVPWAAKGLVIDRVNQMYLFSGYQVWQLDSEERSWIPLIGTEPIAASRWRGQNPNLYADEHLEELEALSTDKLSFRNLNDLASDGKGSLYLADSEAGLVWHFDISTRKLVRIAGKRGEKERKENWRYEGIDDPSMEYLSPAGLALDSQDNLYIADSYANRVLRINPVVGQLTVVAGTGKSGYSGDGGPADKAILDTPHDVAIDEGGNLFVADGGNHCIRMVEANTTIIRTMAGQCGATFDGYGGFNGYDGRASRTLLANPSAIAIMPDGLLVRDLADSRGAIRRVVWTKLPWQKQPRYNTAKK
jgi:hypothetical protein